MRFAWARWRVSASPSSRPARPAACLRADVAMLHKGLLAGGGQGARRPPAFTASTLGFKK